MNLLIVLRNILILSTSGIVLFSKEIVRPLSQPRLLGSLLTAILQYSQASVGMPATYIELDTVAVSISISEKRKLSCCLVHDVEDGEDFGLLLSSTILYKFLEEFESLTTVMSVNLSAYFRFSTQLQEVVKSTITTVLLQLEQQAGVIQAVVVTEDQQLLCTGSIDRLAMNAHLTSLMDAATDVMFEQNDEAQGIYMETDDSRLFVYRISSAIFHLSFSFSVHPQECAAIAKNGRHLLSLTFNLLTCLQAE
jgi:hypothetical protein